MLSTEKEKSLCISKTKMSTTHVCTEAYSKNGVSIVSSVTLKVFILRVPNPGTGNMVTCYWEG